MEGNEAGSEHVSCGDILKHFPECSKIQCIFTCSDFLTYMFSAPMHTRSVEAAVITEKQHFSVVSDLDKWYTTSTKRVVFKDAMQLTCSSKHCVLCRDSGRSVMLPYYSLPDYTLLQMIAVSMRHVFLRHRMCEDGDSTLGSH